MISVLWTDADTAKARELIAVVADNATFVLELGRTKAAAYARVRSLDNPKRVRKPDGRRAANGGFVENPRPLDIPPEVAADAVYRRQLSPASITAALFGDPAPGYSALDRRNGGL